MRLQIVNPESIVLSKEGVDIVLADTPRGSVGILPHHAPFFTDLAPLGRITYDISGERHQVSIAGGVLHVLSDTITVMTQTEPSSQPV